MAVQPICEELQLDYLAGLLEEYMREDQRYSTEAFFPDELKDGTRWSIDVVTAGRGRGQESARGGAHRDRPRGTRGQVPPGGGGGRRRPRLRGPGRCREHSVGARS
mgnify:CR=1 FL=1